MASIPPNEPDNPYELGGTRHIGISDTEWEGHLDEWFYAHPGFRRQTYIADHQPADGQFEVLWKEIMGVKRLIMDEQTNHGPMSLLANVRPVQASLGDVVKQAGPIKNAVCLGLGSIEYRHPWDYNHNFVQQCGMFFALCQMIEEKQNMQLGTLPVVFQEPRFEIEDRFILEKIGRQIIVEAPEANNHMDVQSFVHAPHFPGNLLFDIILRPGREPELLYTNTFHGGDLGCIGWNITDSYLNKVYYTKDTTLNAEAIDLYNKACRFLATHEGIVYWGVYAHEYRYPRLARILKAAFSRSSFYLRKRDAMTLDLLMARIATA
ncbi:unnamed protein product [Aureobasidium vineae]|uniref:SRR1-like domain-containing protein n=1 Tax=Aureobasidium vineae TaxID=2773715 RepID=A0A9N8JW73_9PEZI|nr:unnamed protein product [Aureobasidium vineae]